LASCSLSVYTDWREAVVAETRQIKHLPSEVCVIPVKATMHVVFCKWVYAYVLDRSVRHDSPPSDVIKVPVALPRDSHVTYE